MNAHARLLDDLRQQHAEWEPWLRVIEVALRASDDPAWHDMVPEASSVANATPRLAGATLRMRRTAVQTYLDRLLRTASRSGTREMATLVTATGGRLDALVAFRAALCHERGEIASAAARCGADPDALQAVVTLLAVPFLQACSRAWGTLHDWMEPYCPACGSWPAFVEVRGIERSRHHRCGPCGSEWYARGLVCPFCGTTDHEALDFLVPGDPRPSAAVEACRTCRGYLKAFNRLQGCQPRAVLLEDLGAVSLDLTAIEHGYCRPATTGYPLDVTITEAAATRRLFAWNG